MAKKKSPPRKAPKKTSARKSPKKAAAAPKPLKQTGAFKAHDKVLEFKGMEAIDTGALECFPYEYPGEDIDISTGTEEFTSVCPFSGLPDFGRLRITYTPNELCVELRSLKYYLLSYRNVGIFYEHLANRLRQDLVRLLDPKYLFIELHMTVRGGLQTTITAEYLSDLDFDDDLFDDIGFDDDGN